MGIVKNKFGEGALFELSDVFGPNHPVYVECAACMSIYSDMLSALQDKSKFRTTRIPIDGQNIVVLGCQVTDLAILNDIRTADQLHEKYPMSDIFMGGCLAQRFDIELPNYIKRLNVCRKENVPIDDYSPVVWQKPFWVSEEDQNLGEMDGAGTLFRNRYPLKTGAGCHGKCKYCTIRDTRGKTYESDAFKQIEEFLSHENIVLISDSPTVRQVKDWCYLANRYRKAISFRNVEPQVVMFCKEELKRLAELGLLDILHCPIQSQDEDIISAMGRDVRNTIDFIDFAQELRRNHNVKVATNIIIDYEIEGVIYHNRDDKWLNEHFDYWVWNPYFDGKWDRAKAEKRFEKYINQIKCEDTQLCGEQNEATIEKDESGPVL